MTDVKADVTALVLAGGKARRMGGNDKGLIPVAGQAMVQWVTQALAAQCAEVLISANRNIEQYQALTGLTVIKDSVEDFAGPLAGMAAGLEQSATPLLACVPCDSPFVSADLIARLQRALNEQDAQLAVAHDGQRMQPVFVLLKRELLPSMQQYLRDGGRKIDAWYAQHKIASVLFSDRPDMFLNINTPEQHDELQLRMQNDASSQPSDSSWVSTTAE